jgi:hypothetical protein
MCGWARRRGGIAWPGPSHRSNAGWTVHPPEPNGNARRRVRLRQSCERDHGASNPGAKKLCLEIILGHAGIDGDPPFTIRDGEAQHEKDRCRCGSCNLVHVVGRTRRRAGRRCRLGGSVGSGRFRPRRSARRPRGRLHRGTRDRSLVGTEAAFAAIRKAEMSPPNLEINRGRPAPSIMRVAVR